MIHKIASAALLLLCSGNLRMFASSRPTRLGRPPEDIFLGPDWKESSHHQPMKGRRTQTKQLDRVGNDGSPSDRYPLGKCEGDCDNDNECKLNLKCFQRGSSDPGPPGCSGSVEGSTDYCYNEQDEPGPGLPPPGTLGRVFNNGSPSSLYPLDHCLGDCDSDSDCSGNLKCFQRSSSDPGPPGCSGSVEGSTDYCYDDQDEPGPGLPPPGTLGRVFNNGSPSSLYPLDHCLGDCDSDSDCSGNLKCFQRGSSDPGPPGCSGSVEGSTDYCYDDQEDPGPGLPPPGTLDRVYNDGSPSSLYPLDRCWGDCDSDSDCSGNLKCCQRGSGDPGPPNCLGETSGDTDYCYDPADGDCDSGGSDSGSGSCSGNAFLLKMYWEEGYYWQESSKEKKYCMECEGSCSSGDKMEVHKCDSNSECLVWHNLYTSGGQEFTQIKIADKNLCFEIVGNNRMELMDCVADASTYPRQQFVALNGSFTGPGRFEIGTLFRNGCLTQQHHPKPGEEIKREDCPDTRDDDTSFWVLY